MRQLAPEPTVLFELVGQLGYRPGWTFALKDHDRGQGSQGLTLIITTLGYNAYHVEEGEHYRVNHFMPVPPAAYDARSWRRWLLEQCMLVDRHEACEFFRIERHGEFHLADGTPTDTLIDRPYAPSHGPGNDPYLIREVGTQEDRETSFRGDRR